MAQEEEAPLPVEYGAPKIKVCSYIVLMALEKFFEGRRQTACKPGSVPALRQGMTIPLGRPLPDASRDRPGWRRGNAPGLAACHPYLVLLPVGFALPSPLPAARCALTAPFHPCRPARLAAGGEAVCFCGTFPGVAPAGRYPAPCFRGARTFLDPAVTGEAAVIQPSGEGRGRDAGRRSQPEARSRISSSPSLLGDPRLSSPRSRPEI
jgi:hypothetical protein